MIREYQKVVAGEVTRFEGHVAKYMGDGVLAYFGYPRAHEDDAERAVRAGLALAEAVGRLATPAGEPIAARIGIATGLVVVGELIGDGAAQEQAVVGETRTLPPGFRALLLLAASSSAGARGGSWAVCSRSQTLVPSTSRASANRSGRGAWSASVPPRTVSKRCIRVA